MTPDACRRALDAGCWIPRPPDVAWAGWVGSRIQNQASGGRVVAA